VGTSLRATAANPVYIVEVARQAGVLASAKSELLDSLVSNSGLDDTRRRALRLALEEGIPVGWLEIQLETFLTGVVAYLGSDDDCLSIEIPVVELKVVLLDSIRRHLGEEFYLNAARGLQDLPDYVDIGATLDEPTLARARPVWRAATMAPVVAGIYGLGLSILLWTFGGRGARGVAAGGGVWAAGGLAVIGISVTLGLLAMDVTASYLPATVPELESLSLRSLALAALSGVRSHLLATGSGAVAAGLFALTLPRAERERNGRRGREPGRGPVAGRNPSRRRA